MVLPGIGSHPVGHIHLNSSGGAAKTNGMLSNKKLKAVSNTIIFLYIFLSPCLMVSWITSPRNRNLIHLLFGQRHWVHNARLVGKHLYHSCLQEMREPHGVQPGSLRNFGISFGKVWMLSPEYIPIKKCCVCQTSSRVFSCLSRQLNFCTTPA